MPIVRMPDESGTLVRFPDEMPREEIQQHILSKFPDAADRVSQSQNGHQESAGRPWERYQQPNGNSGPWERYQTSAPHSGETAQPQSGGAALPAGFRIISSPGPDLPPGFRLIEGSGAEQQRTTIDEQARARALLLLQQQRELLAARPPESWTYSDLRDVGMIQATPGNEDLWMPDAGAPVNRH